MGASHIDNTNSQLCGKFITHHKHIILITPYNLMTDMLSQTLSQDQPKHKIVVALEMMSTSDEKVHNLC